MGFVFLWVFYLEIILKLVVLSKKVFVKVVHFGNYLNIYRNILKKKKTHLYIVRTKTMVNIVYMDSEMYKTDEPIKILLKDFFFIKNKYLKLKLQNPRSCYPVFDIA